MAGILASITSFNTIATNQSLTFVFNELQSINEDRAKDYPALLINAQGVTKRHIEINKDYLPRYREYKTRFFFFDLYKNSEKETKTLQEKYGDVELIAEKYFAEVMETVMSTPTDIADFDYEQEAFMVFDQHNDKLIQVSYNVTWKALSDCDVYCSTEAPTILTATAVSTSQINLSWVDNSGGTATFSIERSTTYVTGFTVIASPIAGTTTYNDTGLVAGTTYFYRIRALDTCYSRYSDIAFDCTETSGGACADATAVLKDTAGSTISITTIASGGTENITAPDGVVTITDTTPSTLYTVNVKSDGTETQAIADSVITLNNSVPTLISTTNVKAEATATIVAPDATAVIKDSAGTTLKTEAIPSGVSENITVNDSSLTVNTTPVLTILAEGTADLEVKNTLGNAVGGHGGGALWNITNATIQLNSIDVKYAPAEATINIPIEDSVGNLVGTGNDTIEKWVISDCTVTVNGNSFNTVLAEGSIDVPVEYANGTPVGTIVGGIVEIPNPITPSGIVYRRPILSGQLTSYRTGDDAWHLANGTYDYTPPTNPSSVAQLDTTHATPFLMLKENNAFGNKNRFTDDGGNQTYANDYVIDHLTGLGWYRLTQGASTNWNDNIDAAEASVILGYTDWRMANVKEYDSIGNRRMVGFNYAPFNLTGSPISAYQTSTTNSNNTANYVRYQITTFIQQSSDAKTTALASRAMLLIRNHY